MKSANQLYKESNSVLPFKEWLNEQKANGVLKEPKKDIQITEYQNTTDEKSTSIQLFGVDIKYIAIGVLVVGGAFAAYKYWKKKQ